MQTLSYQEKINVRLRLRVMLANRVNAAMLEWSAKIRAAWAPLGKFKVLTADYQRLTMKATDALPDLPNSTSLLVFTTCNKYGVNLTVRACATDEGETSYWEETASLAELEGQDCSKLVELRPEWFRTDYDFNQIQQARERVRVCEKELERAKSELARFGMSDR